MGERAGILDELMGAQPRTSLMRSTARERCVGGELLVAKNRQPFLQA